MNHDQMRKAERAWRRDFESPPSRKGREAAFQAECSANDRRLKDKASGPASGSPMKSLGKTETFAQRLADSIAKSGMRKGVIASTIGVHPVSLSRWIKGSQIPRGADVYKLADTIGVDPGWLIFGSSIPGRAAPRPSPERDRLLIVVGNLGCTSYEDFIQRILSLSQEDMGAIRGIMHPKNGTIYKS